MLKRQLAVAKLKHGGRIPQLQRKQVLKDRLRLGPFRQLNVHLGQQRKRLGVVRLSLDGPVGVAQRVVEVFIAIARHTEIEVDARERGIELLRLAQPLGRGGQVAGADQQFAVLLQHGRRAGVQLDAALDCGERLLVLPRQVVRLCQVEESFGRLRFRLDLTVKQRNGASGVSICQGQDSELEHQLRVRRRQPVGGLVGLFCLGVPARILQQRALELPRRGVGRVLRPQGLREAESLRGIATPSRGKRLVQAGLGRASGCRVGCRPGLRRGCWQQGKRHAERQRENAGREQVGHRGLTRQPRAQGLPTILVQRRRQRSRAFCGLGIDTLRTGRLLLPSKAGQAFHQKTNA